MAHFSATTDEKSVGQIPMDTPLARRLDSA
jgi:hypothetical protein